MVLKEFHLYRFSLHENVNSALGKLDEQVISFRAKAASSHSELEDIISRLTLADINRALYRCEEEERDETKGASGAYDIPDFGPVVYCGLQGKYSQYPESVHIVI
jgi:glycogen debranching enzyme